MKKLGLFCLLWLAIYGCKKDDASPPSSNTNPPPTETRMRMTGRFDFEPSSIINSCGVELVLGRIGGDITWTASLGSISYGDTARSFDFYINHSLDSLKGGVHEVAFGVSYMYNSTLYSATIVKKINFTSRMDLGNIGFLNNDWFSVPKLELVDDSTGAKYYYSK